MRSVFGSKVDMNVESSTTGSEFQSGLAPRPSLLQHRFPSMKVKRVDVHPVRPWILFSDKHAKGQIYLYDYEQNDVLHSFSVASIFEQRKEEIQLLRVLERTYNGITMPDWYLNELIHSQPHSHSQSHSQLQSQSSGAADAAAQAVEATIRAAGEVRDLRLFDEEIVHWKLNVEKTRDERVGIVRSGSRNLKTLQSVGKRLGYASMDFMSQASGGGDGKSSKFAPSRPPRCIVLQLDKSMVMLRYDEVSSSMYVFDELKHSQLDNKNITCMEFIYSQPIIAIGCSDGSIRLWNYSEKQVLKKVIMAHTKSVQKMVVVHRDDPLISLPSIISCATDGSLCSFNAEKNLPEFQFAKAHENGTIVDFFLDTETNTIVSLGSDKTIMLRRCSDGQILNKYKSTSKVALSTMCQITACNSVPTWFMLAGMSTKIFRIANDLNKDTWDENLDAAQNPAVKHGKFYIVKTHPLRPNILFCGTNFGLLHFKMDINRTPNYAIGINIPIANPSQPSSLKSTNFGDAKATNKSLFYIKDSTVLQRSVISSSGQQYYSDPIKVIDMLRPGNATIAISASGIYFSLLWETDGVYSIYRTDTWKIVANGNQTINLAWSPISDRLAVLKQTDSKKKVLSLLKIADFSLSEVCASIALPSSPKQIFKGPLLGVSFDAKVEEASFTFVTWDGTVVPAPLPKPHFVRWDRSTARCIMAYTDSYAVFSALPEFHMEVYLKEKLENALWWNSTLFVVTPNEIKCHFPNKKDKIDTVLLATFDMATYTLFANAPEEDSLDPIPQSRPKGSITLVDIVGDNLYMIDSTSSIHSLSLDYPSLKFRMLAMSKQVDKALEWVSFIPEDLHDYLAEFLVERGFAVEAVKHMVAMNASKRFNLCLQYKLCQEGYISLQALDLKRGRDHKQLKDGKVCKLYIRLATICVLQQENDLAQKCYIRASELSDSAFNDLIAFYARFKRTNEMTELKKQLEERQTNGSCNYSAELSMLDVFLQNRTAAAHHLASSNDFALALALQGYDREDALVEKWHQELKEKYPHVLPIRELKN